jgi:hypothetical protein
MHMHQTIKNCRYQSLLYALGQCGFAEHTDFDQVRDEKFAELIVRECAKLASKRYDNHDLVHGQDLLDHFGFTGVPEPRKLIGYCERPEGFYRVYGPVPGQIVTQAAIVCSRCESVVHMCMGPRSDVICLRCFDTLGDQ